MSGSKAALRRIVGGNDEPKRTTCLKTLRVLTRNLAKEPGNAKYRKVNLENKALTARVFSVSGGTDFLVALGFVQEGSSLVLRGDASDATVQQNMQEAVAMINRALAPPPLKGSDAEYREQQRLECAKRTEKMREARAKKEREKKLLLARMRGDQREQEERNATRAKKASKAQKLNFGTKPTTFKDIGVKLSNGGGG